MRVVRSVMEFLIEGLLQVVPVAGEPVGVPGGHLRRLGLDPGHWAPVAGNEWTHPTPAHAMSPA